MVGIDSEDEFGPAYAAVTPPDRELDASVTSGGWSPPLTRAEASLLRDGYSREQIIMRREMEARTRFHASQDEDPAKLANVLKDEFGFDPNEDKELTEEALVIINEHGKGLRLGLKQWAIVQRLVEHGIVSGRAGS